MVVAEIKYRVCPRPFKRPREARRVWDGYGTGMGRVLDGHGTGMGRLRDGTGSSTIKCLHQVLVALNLLVVAK